MKKNLQLCEGRPSNGTTLSTDLFPGPQKAGPSREAIEKKAYGIWLAHNRETGCEQKHWLDAEKELRQMAGQRPA